MKNKILNTTLAGLVISASCIVNVANAGIIHWADWQSGTSSVTNGPITEVLGEFVTNTSNVGITYTNNQGIAFLQTGTGTDYFNSTQNPTVSPYTSTLVDNTPTPSEMIALENMGSQTLSFSESVANIVFSYVSLNNNGYSFDQDFDILSVGSVNGKSNGYFGSGTSHKEVIDLGNGDFEYRLLGTGEPHGTIQFKGSFNEVTWNSLSNEYWNGFTVGIQGTSRDVFIDVPEPSTFAIFALGLIGLASRKFKKNS
jgi:hypothetical protein